ncbi:PstS family phosphate ABC transporter substrate-binding protein [Imhoffiella purpurea]|uniref:PBP domain-containing protein n=1 Tax=Imhoffiella purpurea TaxID=1249627 RepID=W9V6F1_9GAMM|nr:substrate-binding domain-containing protein [Imhoffiella purpurea]EXJ14954.1 hypothetical protein D779_2009 [Imhoffiella purpurea]
MPIRGLRGTGLIALLTSSCWAAPVAHASEAMLIGGTGGALGTLAHLLTAYRSLHPDSELELLETSLGTGGGIRALTDGRLAIALAARDLTESERASGIRVHPFARTPLVFVTQPAVEEKGLTIRTLSEIYRGLRTTWSDDSHCRPVMRPSTDSDTMVIRTLDPELARSVDIAVRRSDLLVPLTSQENLDTIARIPGAFGYAPYAQLSSENRDLPILAFEGEEPIRDGRANRAYALWTDFSLVTRPAPPPEVSRFVDFVYSGRGRAIIQSEGNLALPAPASAP